MIPDPERLTARILQLKGYSGLDAEEFLDLVLRTLLTAGNETSTPSEATHSSTGAVQ